MLLQSGDQSQCPQVPLCIQDVMRCDVMHLVAFLPKNPSNHEKKNIRQISVERHSTKHPTAAPQNRQGLQNNESLSSKQTVPGAGDSVVHGRSRSLPVTRDRLDYSWGFLVSFL